MRIGQGYDVHKLVEDRDLILGGVKIPYSLGLLGHSDADVLLHAIMDSLLGAASLGDIGKPSMCKRILKNQTSPSGDVPFYKIGTFGKKPDAFISQEIFDEYRTKYSLEEFLSQIGTKQD